MPIYTATIILLTELGSNWRVLNRNEVQRKIILYYNSIIFPKLFIPRIDATSQWEHINATFKVVSTEVFGFRLPGRKEWVSDTIWVES